MEIDITKYPEGPKEVIKYMDYLPEDNQLRMQILMGFVTLACTEMGG